MKTLLFQPVNLTDVWQPNPRWKGPENPDAWGISRYVPQTDWYDACRKLGFDDIFFVGNEDLNRVGVWQNSTGPANQNPSVYPPVPFSGPFVDQKNALPPNLGAVQALAGLSLNPYRFGVSTAKPRTPICFDIEDDGSGAFQNTLYAGMSTTTTQRQNAARLMIQVIRSVKQVDQHIPVMWYNAPDWIDHEIVDDATYINWRDTLICQSQVAAELNFGCYSLYAWDAVIQNPAVNFKLAAEVKSHYAQFFPSRMDSRVVLISPVMYPNTNGSLASMSGQPVDLHQWQRWVDYLLDIDKPWAICLWPAGIVDPVMPHIEYLAKAAS